MQSIIAEIITTANETWLSKKREIISLLRSQKDETEKIIDGFTIIIDSLKDTVESSVHIKELSKKIAKEYEKFQEVKSKPQSLQIKQERMNSA